MTGLAANWVTGLAASWVTGLAAGWVTGLAVSWVTGLSATFFCVCARKDKHIFSEDAFFGSVNKLDQWSCSRDVLLN